ncbi:MAG: hypothetical protein ACK4M7_01120 [Burkholderiales bacterium]
METMKVLYLRLDFNYAILNHNEEFIKFFDIKAMPVINKPLNKVLPISNPKAYAIIKKLRFSETQSVIVLRNQILNNLIESNALFMLYVSIQKEENSYSIKIVNWLNWLHNLYKSKENNYNFAGNLNHEEYKDKFRKISDVCCFKALFPLLMHTPFKFGGAIHSNTLYDILHIFVNKRKDNAYTKDYSRNVYSRLKTTLRKEYGLIDADLYDIIKHEKLLNFRYNSEIYIPNTAVYEDVVMPIKGDKFLNYIMNLICHG